MPSPKRTCISLLFPVHFSPIPSAWKFQSKSKKHFFGAKLTSLRKQRLDSNLEGHLDSNVAVAALEAPFTAGRTGIPSAPI